MESKFNCEKCNVSFNYKSKYEEHLISKKHKGEPRKERSDKLYGSNCKNCMYSTENTTNMKVHILTKHSTPEERKKQFRYYCEKCDFGTFLEILFTRHSETKKHTEKSLEVGVLNA